MKKSLVFFGILVLSIGCLFSGTLYTNSSYYFINNMETEFSVDIPNDISRIDYYKQTAIDGSVYISVYEVSDSLGVLELINGEKELDNAIFNERYDSFKQECSGLTSDGVCCYFDYYKENRFHYLVFKYCDEENILIIVKDVSQYNDLVN